MELAEIREFQPDASLLSQSWFIATVIRLSEAQAQAGGKSYIYYYTAESAVPM